MLHCSRVSCPRSCLRGSSNHLAPSHRTASARLIWIIKFMQMSVYGGCVCMSMRNWLYRAISPPHALQSPVWISVSQPNLLYRARPVAALSRLSLHDIGLCLCWWFLVVCSRIAYNTHTHTPKIPITKSPCNLIWATQHTLQAIPLIFGRQQKSLAQSLISCIREMRVFRIFDGSPTIAIGSHW